MSTVLIFKEQMLPISETFIKAQAESVHGFDIRYAGIIPGVPSLPLNREVALLVNDFDRMAQLRLALFRRFGFAPGFFRKLAAWNPRLIHAHFAPDGLAAVPIAQRLKAPLIVSLHGYDVTVKRKPNVDYSALYEGASLFLCVSDFIRRQAIAAGFPESKLVVHYIGVDCEMFTPRTSLDQVTPASVLFVGRLVEKKGCTYLLSAMQQVQKVVPEATLTIIGNGPLRSSLEAQAKDLGIDCVFLGSQSSAVVREQMRQTAVFCAPSVTAADGDSEGLPISILEALGTGLPVISTFHAGIPEAIHHRESGLLVQERDINGLAHCILDCLRDPAFALRLARRGTSELHQRFSLKTQALELENYYRDLSR